jgi:hypothetical protein
VEGLQDITVDGGRNVSVNQQETKEIWGNRTLTVHGTETKTVDSPTQNHYKSLKLDYNYGFKNELFMGQKTDTNLALALETFVGVKIALGAALFLNHVRGVKIGREAVELEKADVQFKNASAARILKSTVNLFIS